MKLTGHKTESVYRRYAIAYRLLVAVDRLPRVSSVVLGSYRPSLLILLDVSGASLLALAILLLLFDVNRSALLRLYRGALARCFLSLPVDRTWNPDTPASLDAPLHDGRHYQRPFHIINATANAWSLISGTVPFTFSRLFCGVGGLSFTAASYRPTAQMSDGRLSIAMALAISGAAVSPNARGFSGTLGFTLGFGKRPPRCVAGQSVTRKRVAGTVAATGRAVSVPRTPRQ